MDETNVNNPKRFWPIPKKWLIISIACAVIAAAGAFGYFKFYNPQSTSAAYSPHVAFLDEVYSSISDNYWDKVEEEPLVNLYVAALEKVSGEKLTNPPKTRADLIKFLETFLAKYDDKKKTEVASATADLVLANLQPFGRSRLYTQKEQQALQDNLNNISSTDQYKVLGLTNTAKPEEIEAAYTRELAAAQKDSSAEGKKKQEAINHAYSTLSDAQTRQKYDEVKVEPSWEGRLITPQIYYLKMSKFSPTMMDELVATTKKVDQGDQLDTLIFDLRDNVGGLIDGLPYLLGPFIGPDQYAYQFFRKGEKADFKTKTGWLETLYRYKKVVILINENTQSSGEVMAATLKKYNVGVVVGTKTRGWGTVEKVYELKNQPDPSQKFSTFIVNHLTLREDGQPIEGKGVEPVIDVSQPNWEQELLRYYNYPPLVEAVSKLVGK